MANSVAAVAFHRHRGGPGQDLELDVGSRSAYVDLANPAGQEPATALLADTDIVINNHRTGSPERRGLEPHRLAERHPGLVYVSVTCYGSRGPLGDVHMLAPPVRLSATAPAWPAPLLVPRGSSSAAWRS